MLNLCAIRRLQSALRSFEERLKDETGLSFNDALLLCAVEKGIVEPSALAKELDLSPSRLTRVIDSLEGRSLVQRTLSITDRRSLVISLTEAGEELVLAYNCCELQIPEELAFTQEESWQHI
ncbi:MAG TPA: MarR family transcriptional regulator [Sphaerochaeta sp.]|nr:MarR family transcriptional regulator [Sphaerochaeta sp.]HOR80498.1 MarR family transcriptional regulator [Sphaerochaeta sp.]HPK63293.1 MarR family transcriptional regulator [Sphaerochaeta sp.]